MDRVIGVRILVLKPAAVRVEYRHQILGPGKDIDIRLLAIQVPGKTFIGFPGDRRKRKTPAEPERAIASAGVIGERKLWTESRSARRSSNGHCHRTGASHRVGGELLAHAADGATAFWERNCRRYDLLLAVRLTRDFLN